MCVSGFGSRIQFQEVLGCVRVWGFGFLRRVCMSQPHGLPADDAAWDTVPSLDLRIRAFGFDSRTFFGRRFE